MSNLGVHLDDDLLAHMALHHLPTKHLTTRQVMIATAESSDTALTLTGVLSQIQELIRDTNSTTNTATALNVRAKQSNINNRSSSYEQCTNGHRNPKTAHSEENCWQLHPSKNPHSNAQSSANVDTITGRALCTRVTNGAVYEKAILESGSSHHMFNNKKHFVSHQPQETKIKVANGDSMTGLGVGTVGGSSLGLPLPLSDALLVPELKYNLVSLVKLAQKGCSLEFKDNNRFEVKQDDKIALTGRIINRLMGLDLEIGKSYLSKHLSPPTAADGTLLHSRLGHPGTCPFQKAFPGYSPPTHCDPCVMAKHHRLPYGGKFKVAKDILDLLHSDLSRIIYPSSLGGN